MPVTLALLIAGIVWRFYLLHTGASDTRLFFSTDTRGEGLLIGCLFAGIWMSPRRDAVERFARTFAPYAIPVVAVAAFSTLPWRLMQAGSLTIACVMMALIIIRALDPASSLAHALSVRPARWLGRVSYSLYLYMPIFRSRDERAALDLRPRPQRGLRLVREPLARRRPSVRRRPVFGANAQVARLSDPVPRTKRVADLVENRLARPGAARQVGEPDPRPRRDRIRRTQLRRTRAASGASELTSQRPATGREPATPSRE